MGDTIVEHNGWTTKLVHGGVDIPAQDGVQGGVTSQDDWGILGLDDTLAQPNKVRSNTNGAPSNVIQGEGILVSPASLTGNQTRSTQVLHTNTNILANDIRQFETLLTICVNHVSQHSTWGQGGVIRLSQVQVVIALARVCSVLEGNLKLRLELLDEADAGPRVAGNVHTWQTLLPGPLRGSIEEFVLLHTEGTILHCDVIGNDHQLATLGVLWGLHVADPSQHTDVVGTNDVEFHGADRAILIHLQGIGLEDVGRDGGRALTKRGGLIQVGIPLLDQLPLHESQEVIGVCGPHAPGSSTLQAYAGGSGVGLKGADTLFIIPKSAEPLSDACRAVGVLAPGIHSQPLPGHGGGNQAQEMATSILLRNTNLDLNLIHSEFQQPVSIVGQQLIHDVVEIHQRVISVEEQGCGQIEEHP
mmetsp:Transcript_146255/g.255414  ORF Transcript_146255/g.255414 Transcript_146255/m.255414 type:complete len:416 (+) Transcript_146255:1384-2631(+)